MKRNLFYLLGAIYFGSMAAGHGAIALPDAADDKLDWGPVTNGAQVAIEPQYIVDPAVLASWKESRAVPLNVYVRVVGNMPLKWHVESGLGNVIQITKDAQGKELKLDFTKVSGSGMTNDHLMNPGDVIMEVHPIGLGQLSVFFHESLAISLLLSNASGGDSFLVTSKPMALGKINDLMKLIVSAPDIPIRQVTDAVAKIPFNRTAFNEPVNGIQIMFDMPDMETPNSLDKSVETTHIEFSVVNRGNKTVMWQVPKQTSFGLAPSGVVTFLTTDAQGKKKPLDTGWLQQRISTGLGNNTIAPRGGANGYVELPIAALRALAGNLSMEITFTDADGTNPFKVESPGIDVNEINKFFNILAGRLSSLSTGNTTTGQSAAIPAPKP